MIESEMYVARFTIIVGDQNKTRNQLSNPNVQKNKD